GVPVVLLPGPQLEPAAVRVASGDLERQIPVARVEVPALQIVGRRGRADPDVAQCLQGPLDGELPGAAPLLADDHAALVQQVQQLLATDVQPAGTGDLLGGRQGQVTVDADIAGHRELRGGTGRADADVAVVGGGQAPGVTVVEADLIGGMAADEPVARDPQAAVVVVRLQAAVDHEVEVHPTAAGHG